jgi:hypothetical protein
LGITNELIMALSLSPAPAHNTKAPHKAMSSLFKKLPGFQKTPAGLERQILRRLPHVLWVGTLLAVLGAGLMRVLPWSGSEAEMATRITTVDIYLISLVILHWTVVFTVAIGAFIVMVMKGPAYVADAYPLSDADHPAPDSVHRS